ATCDVKLTKNPSNKYKPTVSVSYYDQGNIIQLEKVRGTKKALEKMVKHMLEDTPDTSQKTLAIAHCNCRERAEWVRELVLSKASFKDSFIVDTGGISSLYASDGGIIMVV
ncbi:MAG: DegV family protein, partial [Lachnospira sp.]|nr:DegV family protein [Lachnospira sp.]